MHYDMRPRHQPLPRNTPPLSSLKEPYLVVLCIKLITKLRIEARIGPYPASERRLHQVGEKVRGEKGGQTGICMQYFEDQISTSARPALTPQRQGL